MNKKRKRKKIKKIQLLFEIIQEEENEMWHFYLFVFSL